MKAQSICIVTNTLLLLQFSFSPADNSRLPATPSPAECTVEIPTSDELRNRVSMLTAATGGEATIRAIATADALPSSVVATPPSRKAVSVEVEAAVRDTVREWVACQNTSHPLSWLVLVSDTFLLREWADNRGLEAYLDFADSLPPELPTDAALPQELRHALIDIRDIVEVQDGRIGATVLTISHSTQVSPTVALMYFVKENDRYLIDEIRTLQPGQFISPYSTPGPAS